MIATVSPDGRRMLAASDDGHVYIYQLSQNNEYSQVAALKVTQLKDTAALACAWNHNATLFAVTCGDGTVVVYDALTLERRTTLGSIEPRKTRNAPRAIQFSKGPLDLLAYTEHVSLINIVDVRTFETRQVIRLGPADMDSHIAGLDFSADGQSILVALESDLVELPIDTSSRRQFGSGRVHMF